jgi:hypothetical protein
MLKTVLKTMAEVQVQEDNGRLAKRTDQERLRATLELLELAWYVKNVVKEDNPPEGYYLGRAADTEKRLPCLQRMRRPMSMAGSKERTREDF